MRLKFKRSSGITMVELILATILLSVVIMTGLSIEIGLRRLFLTSDREAELMGEVAPIMTFLTKKIALAPGDAGNNPYANQSTAGAGGWTRYRFHHADDNPVNGQWDAATEGWDDFTWLRGVDELWYGRNGVNIMMLSDKVVNLRIDSPFSAAPPHLGYSFILLTLRADPTAAMNVTNPEVTLNTTAQYRGMSVQ